MPSRPTKKRSRLWSRTSGLELLEPAPIIEKLPERRSKARRFFSGILGVFNLRNKLEKARTVAGDEYTQVNSEETVEIVSRIGRTQVNPEETFNQIGCAEVTTEEISPEQRNVPRKVKTTGDLRHGGARVAPLQIPFRKTSLQNDHNPGRPPRTFRSFTTQIPLRSSNSSFGFKSTPSLKRRLSQNLFGSTVIHKPKLSQRENVGSLCLTPAVYFPPSDDATPVITSPTPKPSLRTIELTASTKIYLETHFNKLLTSPNSRSLRRRAMEKLLNKYVMTEYEERLYRDEWRRKETEYLRNLRSKKLTVGNFEVVRVIGRGAFGCVKLAKMKESDEKYAEGGTGMNLDETPTGFKWPNKKKAEIRHIEDVSGTEASQKEQNKKVYALKVIQKAEHLKNGQEGHLRAERDFLVASEGSRWIVPLIASFQDDENLYLVMEYMIGGDFLGLLINRVILDEETTRFYIAEMVLCIEEAHTLSYIHRDIKPDNFCFTSTGHLKICDFGLAFSGHWAHDSAYFEQQRWGLLRRMGVDVKGDTIDRKTGKNMSQLLNAGRDAEVPNKQNILSWRNRKGRRKMAKSVVGTHQYMAPEVVRGEQYDGRCDWWSLGVILYEVYPHRISLEARLTRQCFFGYTPFYADDRAETKSKVVNWKEYINLYKLTKDPPLSEDCKDLILSLICEKEHRLGAHVYSANDNQAPVRASSNSYRKRLQKDRGRVADSPHNPPNYVHPDDAVDIKAHPFFSGIEWEKLHLQTPPFVPEGLNGTTDTKYFSIDYRSDTSYASRPAVSKDSLCYPPPPHPTPVSISAKGNCLGTLQENTNIELSYGQEGGETNKIKELAQEKKKQKRPKDRLLRDKELGQELLEIRKERAFLGYTYKRPASADPEFGKRKKLPNFVEEEKRGFSTVGRSMGRSMRSSGLRSSSSYSGMGMMEASSFGL